MDELIQDLKTMDELRCFCRNNKNNGLKGHSKFTKKEDLKEFIIDNYEGEIDNENTSEIDNENTSDMDNENKQPIILYLNDNLDKTYKITTINGKLYIDINIKNINYNFQIIYTNDNNDAGYLVNEILPYNFIFSCIKINENELFFKIKGVNNNINRFIYDKKFSIDIDLLVSFLDIKYNKGFYNIELDPVYNEYHNIQYNSYKEYFLKSSDIFNEKILFHGTSKENIESIIHEGLSTYPGRAHGEAHGRGIYFSNDIEFSMKYSNDKHRSRYHTNLNTGHTINQNIIDDKIKYIIVAIVGVNNIIEGRRAMGTFPMIEGKDIYYDTGVDNISNPKQWIKKDPNQIKIIGVFKIIKKEKPVVEQNNILEFINRIDKEIYIYLNPLMSDPFGLKYLDVKKCKELGKMSKKPTNFISGGTLKISGYDNDNFICGWYENNNFIVYKSIYGPNHVKNNKWHRSVNKNKQFYIE